MRNHISINTSINYGFRQPNQNNYKNGEYA